MADQNGSTSTLASDAVHQIPIVDLSDPDESNLVRFIAEASKEWGVFQAVNHGVPAEVIARLQAAGTKFFSLTQAEKDEYATPPGAASVEGYGARLYSSKGEHLFHYVWPRRLMDHKFWQKKPEWYTEASEDYGRRVGEVVAEKVFRCLSLGLGLDAHALKDAVGGDALEYLMKVNYYPPIDSDELEIGVAAHSDVSAITVLLPDDVPGLQILKDDSWIDVVYVPNALVVLIGDQVEIASNGYYKSCTHRVIVDKKKARMSWPMFLESPPEFVARPIVPKRSDDQNPKSYAPMKFKDYAFSKLSQLHLNAS